MTTLAQPPYKLGKAAPKADPRNLKLAHFVSLSQLPSPPDDVDFAGNVGATGYPMYANDKYGDCTCAGMAHNFQQQTALTGQEVVPTQSQVLGLYTAVSGFDITTGANDNGAVELDVLNYLRKTGLDDLTIAAHVEVDPKDLEMQQVAHWLFGGLYYGYALPQAWQQMTGPGKVWQAPSGPGASEATGIWTPGTWGGHAVNSSRLYLGKGGGKLVTWAMEQEIEAKAIPLYCDEVHAVLPVNWEANFPEEAKRGGFDWDKLQAALLQVTKEPLNN